MAKSKVQYPRFKDHAGGPKPLDDGSRSGAQGAVDRFPNAVSRWPRFSVPGTRGEWSESFSPFHPCRDIVLDFRFRSPWTKAHGSLMSGYEL